MTTTTLPNGAPRSDPPINDEAVSDLSARNPPSISQRKLEANRRNSRLSTGPKTADGKKMSSRNAASHRLLVKNVVSAGDVNESQAEFDTLLADLRECYEPVNTVEDLLVTEIAISYWRTARALRCEKGYTSRAEAPVKNSELRELDVALLKCDPYPMDVYNSLLETSRGLAFLLRKVEEAKRVVESSGYVSEQLRRWLTPHKNWHSITGKHPLLATLEKETAELTALKRQADEAELHSEDIRRDCSAIPSKEALDRIHRYETANVRHRYKLEARLEQLQARRRGNTKVNSEGYGDAESRQDTQFCEMKTTAPGQPPLQRSGEQLPAPTFGDVSVHASVSTLPEASEESADTEMTDSVPAPLEQPKSLSGEVDVDVEILNSAPEVFEQPMDIPGEE
jgi:hypothetical protein